jgi:Xaa-Pro aminopeptidase
MNRALFEERMAESAFDCIVAFSAENVFYLSGSPTVMKMRDFQQTRPNSPRLVMVVQPRDDEPTLITPAVNVGLNKATAWVKDVRGYAEYDVLPMAMLAQVLKDRGLGDGCIGLDMAAMAVPQYRHLVELLPGAAFEDCGSLMAEVRSIKTPEEVAMMKEAVDLMDDAYLETFTSARIGDTELELDRSMLLNMISRGFECVRDYGSTLVGKGVPDVHRAPSEEKRLEPGEIVRTDYIGHWKNYTANLSSVAVAGEPSAELREVYGALLEVERETAQYMRPGLRACDVYSYLHEAILERGYKHHLPLVGHNIGLDVHELPVIVASDKTPLKANMVICLEPVISPYYHLQDQYLLTEKGGQLLSDKFNTDGMFVIE